MVFGTLYDYIVYQRLVKNVDQNEFYEQQSQSKKRQVLPLISLAFLCLYIDSI